jgi:hypothetical protein
MQTLGRLRNLIRAFRLKAIIKQNFICEQTVIPKLRRSYSDFGASFGSGFGSGFGSSFASAGAAVESSAPPGATCDVLSVETGGPVDSVGGDSGAGVLTDCGVG